MLSEQLREGFLPTPDPGVWCISVWRLQPLSFTHLPWIGVIGLEKRRLASQPQAKELHFHFALSPTNYVAGPGVGLSMDKA